MESTVVQEVRRFYEVERLSLRQIAQKLRVSRKKVSRIIQTESLKKPASEDERLIREYYQEYPFLKATQVYERLKSYGFTGGYEKVKTCTRPWRKKHSGSLSGEGGIIPPGRWMLMLLQRKITATSLVQELRGKLTLEDAEVLIARIHNGGLRDRNRALSVLAHLRGMTLRQIASFLMINRRTVTQSVKHYRDHGISKLFSLREDTPKKHEQAAYKDALFTILHSPPGDHGINRTTWTMADLHRVMREMKLPINKKGLRSIIKDAGFRFRKAKKVLTSTDPEYRQKLQAITGILSGLSESERFFSIDEFGPVSIRTQGGRALAAPGEQRVVPQRQRSRGRLMLIGALELSTNQITHFYVDRKNTAEMIRLLHMLLSQYKDQERLYLSWDAASWHSSKEFEREVE